MTLTTDIKLTIFKSLTLRLGNDFTTIDIEVRTIDPIIKKSITIDKSQYIDIEENQDIDIVIDIEDSQ